MATTIELPATSGGGAPTGSAGGDLGGTYPNPTLISITGATGVVAVAATGNIITWNAATTAPGIKQADNTTNSATAATITIQAPNATGTTATGGTLKLQSGTGTSQDGYLSLFVGTNQIGQLSRTSSDFIKIGGANVASTGLIRAANNTTVLAARGANNTADIPLIVVDSSNNVTIGDTTSANATNGLTLKAFSTLSISGNALTQVCATTVQIKRTAGASGGLNCVIHETSASSLTLAPGSTSFGITQTTQASDIATASITVTPQAPFASATGTNKNPGNLNLTIPAPVSGGTTGNIALNGNAVVGYVTQAMADTAQTLSDANSAKNCIITTGANTSVRALTINSPPTAGTIKFIRNNCTANGITVQFATGSATGTIAPATSAVVIGDGTNAVVLITGT